MLLAGGVAKVGDEVVEEVLEIGAKLPAVGRSDEAVDVHVAVESVKDLPVCTVDVGPADGVANGVDATKSSEPVGSVSLLPSSPLRLQTGLGRRLM